MVGYFPGLEGEKSDDLSEEDIALKISKLNERIGISYKLGRTDSLPQLRLLVEHYQFMLREKVMKEQQDLIDADPKLGRTVIDIDWPDPADEKNDETF